MDLTCYLENKGKYISDKYLRAVSEGKKESKRKEGIWDPVTIAKSKLTS